MVSQNDLSRISRLYRESARITEALEEFAAGGQITAMTITGPEGRPVFMSTAELSYPPQMVDAIRVAWEARQTAIRQELAQLGVTMA